MLKKIIYLIITYLFITPTIIYAADNAFLSLSANTQTPTVGKTLEVQININFNKENRLQEAHYVITISNPDLYKLTEVLWTQSSGSYHVDGNKIYIDKSAVNAEDAWQYGTPVVLRFDVIQTGLAQFTINKSSDCYYFGGSKIYKQSFSGININNLIPDTTTNLKILYVENYAISPTFNKNVYNYTLTVPASVTSVNVVAKKNDETQTITGDGERNLLYGANKITVVVKSESGSIQQYTIMVTRQDDRTGDVSLKNVFVSSQNAIFDSATESFSLTVGKSTENILLTAQTNDAKAELIGTGQKNLAIGLNTFELTVKSLNNIEKTYKVYITRSDEEINENIKSTKIKNLKINNLALDLSDNKTVFLYGTSKDYTSLKIEVIPESETATVDIIGNESLNSGLNVITVKITETTNEFLDYKIIVYKNPSNLTLINNLNNIPVDLKEGIYLRNESSPSVIPNTVLEIIKNNNLKLYYNVTDIYNGLLYQLIFNNKTEYKDEIDTSFNRSSTSPLTYKTSLPENIDVTLYIGDIYQDNIILKVYTYNENGQYTLLTDGVSVTNGYINFTTNGEQNYVFSTNDLINNPNNIINFFKNNKIFIIIIPLTLLIIIILPRLSKKNKKNSNELEY